jgi:hypothetical protein
MNTDKYSSQPTPAQSVHDEAFIVNAYAFLGNQ